MGGLFKGKSQTSTQSSSSNPWAPAQDALKQILADYGQYYQDAQDTGYISSTGDLGSIYSDYLNGLSGITNQSSTGTNSLLNSASNAANSASSVYGNAASGGLNYSTSDLANAASSLVDNDLLNSQITAANQNIVNNLQENTLTGIDRTAVAGGNLGSSRAGIQSALANRDAATLQANNEANIRSSAYQNALSQAQNTLSGNVQTQLAGAQGNANLSNSLASQANNYSGTLLNSLSPLLTSSQLNQTITAANQADQIGERDYLAQLLGNYANIAGSIGGMGGTTTGKTTSPGSSMFSNLLSGASAASSIYSNFSDKRLKKNIVKVGAHNGHNWYKWEWKDEAKALVGDAPTEGVIAQEVMQYKPESVHLDASGFYKVDYKSL